MAVLEKVALMGGEFELVRLSQRPKTWYFRFYVRCSGQQKKEYVVWSLYIDDREQAERWNNIIKCVRSLTVIPGAGHCPPDASPDLVKKAFNAKIITSTNQKSE